MPAGSFQGAARYYANGRPPYSRQMGAVLVSELGLDGSGQLLDVGCGPGILALELAPLFDTVTGVDPEPEMLDEARQRAAEAGRADVRWIEGTAEEVDRLGLEPCRVVTFGQSFHRTDRRRAAAAAYDVLEPGGAIVLVSHAHKDRPQPPNPGAPAIPHEEIHQLIGSYLGPVPVPDGRGERWEQSLRRSAFGAPRLVYAPGVPDYVRDEDSVVANFFSMSFCAPPRFGARRDAFEADLRALLRAHSADGRFWDWPGDTEFVIGTRR